MKNKLLKYKEVLLYLFFGGLTTVINLLVYHFSRSFFSYQISNVLSWLVAVLFAYVTNKWFVFDARNQDGQGLLREIGLFYGARILSLGLEMAMMFVCVSLLKLPDLPVKLFAQVMVIVLNYLFSKFLIFKKADNDKGAES